MSRKRPKRQRNPTTIYSDDRPNTFTTKRWKGQIVYGPEQPQQLAANASAPASAPTVPSKTNESTRSTTTTTTTETTVAINKRGPGRPPRKKSLEFPPPRRPTSLSNGNKTTAAATITTTTSRSNNGAAAVSLSSAGSTSPIYDKTTNTSLNPSLPVVKRKRGRPPKKKDTGISPSSHSVVRPPPPASTDVRSRTTTPTIKTVTRRTPLPPPPPTKSSTTSAAPTKVAIVSKSTSSPVRRKRSSSHNTTLPALMRTPSWTPPQNDLEGTFLNHAVTLAPILPPVLKNDNYVDATAATTDDVELKQLKAKYPAVYNEGGVPKACTTSVAPFSSSAQSTNVTTILSKNQQLSQTSQLPSWTPLYNPPVYFEDDYDRETGQLDVESTVPVTRQITALTVRKPHHDYLALGDSAGFVLIYALDKMQLPVARLESVACQQRARPEQERLRAELRKRRTKKSSNGSNNNSRRSSKTNGLALMSSSHNNSNHVVSGPQSSSSILIDTSDTTIHALGMIGERVVLATSVELECMDVPSATSLWVCPLTSNRFVTSLDMHLHTFDVLVSCSKNDVPSPSTAAQIQQPSSLMLLQHSKNNVEICDANSPMLVRSPSCTAIWDVGCDNRLMFVALSANRQELELVLVSGGSIEQWKVACKTKIPIKASGSAANYLASSQTKLTQSSSGEYTLVASSRGIRLYQTESLQLIHVYGDQLSLHGQSVMWKDCWLVGSFFHEGKGLHKSRQSAVAPWMEIDDWLAYSMKDDDDDSKIEVEGEKETSNPSKITAATSDLPPYIVGVTHIKGPPELCETLHVWKVEHASVVPSLSIPLPHKGDGALGLAGGGINNASGDDRVIVVTNDGQAHALLPKMESNFAGIMYPPGYQIITDNIEFIEEEDALDEVVEYDDLNDAQGESEDEEVNIFDQVEEEDMDEELKEAMRQSLLEHRRQEEARAAMMHDYDVDILNPQNKDFSFLPCRPEPYLRQFIHTPEDDDDEEDEEETEATKQPGERAAEESDVLLSNPQKEEMSSGASFIAHVLEALPNMEKPQPVEDEDCLSFTTTKVVVAVNPVPVVPARPGRGRKSRAGNVETMLKASINPYLQSMMLEQQGVPTDGSGSHFRKGLNASRDSNANIQLQGRDWNGSNTGHSTPDPRSATADEAAVALGLLGLSPTPGDAAQAKPTDVLATVVPPTTPGVTTSHGSAYLSASTLSSLPVKFGTGGHDAMGNKIEGGTVESMTASSDRGSVTEESVEDVPARPKAPLLCKNCHACRGRHVIHTCGKRALPIDYDEVAKAERERKEKEEEERKRQRAEKRRLADQRRREAKKLKQRELEDQRLREEEDERREREKERRLQEDFASQDLNRQRRNQIVASYAQYQEQGSSELNSVNYSQPKSTSAMTTEVVTPAAPSVFETLSTPQVSSTFEDLSRPRVGSIFEQASRMMDDSGAARFVSAGEMAAMYTKTAGAAARAQSHTCPAPLSIPPPPAVHPLSRASMASAAAQLEALDGLAALAELARVTPAAASKPEAAPVAKERLSSFSYAVQTVAPSTQTSESDLGSFTYAASHGFMSGEVKKGIPSYATIRGQANGDSAPNNGGSEEQLHQQTVETYVWPPRREEQD